MTDSQFYARLFAVVLLAALGFAVIALTRPLAVPICWATLFAFILHPVNVRLRRRFRDRRGFAAFALTFAVLVGFALPSVSIAIAFVNQAAELVKRLAQGSTFGSLEHTPLVERLAHSISSRLFIPADVLLSVIHNNFSRLISAGLMQAESIARGILGAGVDAALTLVILFFALRNGDAAASRFIGILPLREDRRRSLVAHMSAVTRATVLGAIMVALVQGLLVGFSFLVSGLPSPVVFGVLASFASLLPIGGTALVWGPGAIALAVQGRWGAAVFVALWGLVVVFLSDSLIRPRFVSGRAQVPTLGVLLGILGGVPLFGLLGVFLGPILIALAFALLRFAEEEKAA